MLDTADLSPWEGRVFTPKAGEDALLLQPGLEWRATRLGEHIHLALNGRRFLGAEGASRLALQIGTENTTRIAITPNSEATEVTLSFYGITEGGVRACEIDGATVAPMFVEDALLLTIRSRRRSIVQLWHVKRFMDAEPVSGNYADE
jgi:hypothetical protein